MFFNQRPQSSIHLALLKQCVMFFPSLFPSLCNLSYILSLSLCGIPASHICNNPCQTMATLSQKVASSRVQSGGFQ